MVFFIAITYKNTKAVFFSIAKSVATGKIFFPLNSSQKPIKSNQNGSTLSNVSEDLNIIE